MKRPSINHIYRLVWNESKNAYVPAAENTKSHSHPGQTNRLAAVVSALLLPGFIYGDGVVVAPGSGATNVYNAPNGVPVVNIDKANAAGLSHNKFTNYNVGTNGLILNNGNASQMARQSQLAGQVMANTNLSAEARIILNEVVAPNRSQLLGYTEVLGNKADVIVANPYGITCAGCGFINTDRVTLTTGTPTMSVNGGLIGFTVNQGDILIQGNGLDGSEQNYFDILARAVKIDAQINAKDLKIVTGTNTWDYATSQATAIQPSGAAPELAIDSTALGGMYANRIKIIATEAGVGVRVLSEAAALSDDFILTASGKIELKNKISAERDIAVVYSGASTNSADTLNVSGTTAELAAKHHIDLAIANGGVTLSDAKLTAGENLTLSAVSLSDSSIRDAVRFAGAEMNVQVTGIADVSGVTWGSGGRMLMNFGTFNTEGITLYSGSNTSASNRTLEVDVADTMTLNGTSILAGTDLLLGNTLTDTISVSADTTIKSGADISVVANDVIQISGTVLAGDDLTIKAADALGTLTNTGTIQAIDTMTLGETGHILDIVNQVGSAILSDNLSMKADDITNAGTIQATNATLIAGSTLSNASGAKLFVSTQNGSDGVLNIANTVINNGLMQSAGQLDITSGATLTNNGTVLALNSSNGGNDEALNLSSQIFINSGTVDGGGVMNINVSATSGTALQNTGFIQSHDAMTLNSGSDMSNSGSVIGEGSVAIGTSQSSFNLTNTGRVQSGSAMTLGSSGHTVGLNNQSSGTLLAGTTFGLVGGALSNAGIIQANTGSTISASSLSNTGSSAKLLVSTVAGADGSLTLSSSVNNQGIIQSAGGLTLNSLSTIDNSGTIKASGNSDTLSLQATALTNTGYVEASDVMNISLSTTSGTALNNSGQIHSVDAMTLNSGSDISNSGSVIGEGSVEIGTNQSSFNLINTGRVQSGSAMTLGLSGHTVGLSNQSSGTLLAGTTLGVVGTTVDNQGKMYADAGMTWSIASLQNGSSSNSSAVILGAMTSGTTTLALSGTLENYGALHSNDSFNITSYGITNRSTGGISSLSDLSLSTYGSNAIDNYGALYAGSSMSLNAVGGNIYNRSGSGTIDSSGTLSTNSANFTNNNTIVTSGDISISTSSSFTNETTLSDGTTITKSLGGVENSHNFHEAQRLLTEGSAYGGADIKVMEWEFDRQETLNGITKEALSAMPKAQIIANGGGSSLTINYGNSGRNYIALLSAPTVNIGGTGTFTNQDMALYKYSYKTQMIEVHDDYVGAGSGKKKYEFWGRDRSDASYSTNVDGDHDEWGQYHPGNGWSRFRSSDSSEAWNDAQDAYNDAKNRSQDSGAAMSGAVTTDSFGSGIYATNFNFTSGTLANEGSPWPTDSSHTKANNPTTGSVDSKSQSNGSSTSPAGVSSAGNSNLSSKESVIAGTTLSFAGLNLTLPSNPNGYFVVSQDPNAAYLIETNPLFAVGSTFVGSDYMAERYGINPDDTVRRLGDSSYEAYMVRQQLIQQMGTNLIKGYGTEAEQIQQLMDQAVTQGKEMGFTYGKALTASQVANLKEDIVWMEEVEVGGQKVLAPRVYLSQTTKDAILTGAAISADNVNIAGDALNNTGGTIQGSDTLTVKVKNDITNTSGNIQGGNISLTSTEGSIVNQTLTVGQGNDTQYSTSIGKTAGITATGNLDMDAKKDIKVLGADVTAGGDASLSAGGEIRFDTIVDKSTTSSTSNIDAGPLYSSTTNNTTTTETNIGSNLSSGGKLKLKSGGDTVIAGSNVAADGGMDVDAGGSFKVEARQDKVTSKTTSETSGIGVGGGVYGSETTTEENFKGTNKGSSIQVGKAEDQEKRVELFKELQTKSKALSEATDVLMALQSDFKKAAPGSPEAAAIKEKFKTQYTLYKEKLAEAKELKNQLDELPSGDLNVKAGDKFVLQGSDLNVAGNASIDAKMGIQILDGLDEERTTKTTTTTTFLKVDGDGTSSETKANTDSKAEADANANGKRATASASASTSTEKSGETSSDHNLKLAETSTTTSVEGSRSSVASNFNVGGNLNAKTEGTLTIQGSNLNVGGDASLDANQIEVLTGRNEEYSTTNTTTTSVGFYEQSNASSGASADASASAEAKKRNTILGTPSVSAKAQAEANANAEAGADTTLTVGARTENTSESTYNLTNTSSTIKVGGNLDMKAKDKALFVGADIESGGDMTIQANTIENKAAQDISTSTSSSTQVTAGLYVGGEANAQAGAGAESGTQTTGGLYRSASGSAQAGASAEVEVTAGVRAGYESETTTEGSVTNVTNKFKSGGNFKRTATDTILDQGTSIEAEGNIDQSARVIKEEAIHDTTFSSTDTQSHEARAGVYAGADAEAEGSVEGKANSLTGGEIAPDASAGASASAGLKVSYEGSIESESSTTKTAVTSKYKAGGSITSKSTESTTLIGTQFEAGKDITLEGGTIDYQAARDSQTDSSTKHDIAAEGKVGVYGTKGPSGEASYGGEMESESSSTAKTGSMNANGNINIKTTKGDATFEGTNIESKEKVDIQSAGSVNFNAAYDTTESSGQNISAEIGFSKSGKDMGGEVSGGYEQENSSSKTAQTGSIKGSNISVNASKDVTLEGTKLKSSGDTTIEATGDVNLKAATNSETNYGFGIGVEASASKGGEGSSKGVGVEGNANFSKDVTSDTVSIESGGNLNIKAKTITNQEADIKTSGKTTMSGDVKNEKAQDWSHSLGIEGSASAEKETKAPKEGSKTTDDIPDKRPKASDAITKKYSSEAPELGKNKSDSPSTPKSRQEEIQKLKEGWNKQKQNTDKVINTKKTDSPTKADARPVGRTNGIDTGVAKRTEAPAGVAKAAPSGSKAISVDSPTKADARPVGRTNGIDTGVAKRTEAPAEVAKAVPSGK